jgi:BirA family transcriptional regulator, biotin operon repressor / biotin---[acetyl-CoA-carboxylase] ligase
VISWFGILDFHLHRFETYLNEGLPLSDLDGKCLIPEKLPAFQLHFFDTVSSTHDVLWQLIEQKAEGESEEGMVAIALQQQSGRGQWGRSWQSEPGGLYLSLALTPNVAAADSGQLTLSTCWGIAAALRAYEIPVAIKWPNDLVIDRRKLGGILLETRLQKGYIYRALVGVGLNWQNSVPPTGINLQTVLNEQSNPRITSLEQVAAIALQGMMTGYCIWRQHGIESLLPSYQTLLTNVGQTITVNDCLGIITGAAASGDLVVQVLSTTGDSLTKDILLQPGAVSLGYGSSGTE